ncbi:MAG: hypothetical protein Q8L23_10675 [Caulobacter sp.]|nr:hypothetical protein [Caulobacter sp.]
MIDLGLDEANDSPAREAGPIIRASRAHFLELIALISEMMSGDLMKGIVFTAIASANMEIVRRMDMSAETFATSSGVPPDTMRQPVSVYALSKSLGLPYETTRRYVASLIEDGLCVRVDKRGGVIVPAQASAGAKAESLRRRHLASVRKFATAVNGLSR